MKYNSRPRSDELPMLPGMLLKEIDEGWKVQSTPIATVHKVWIDEEFTSVKQFATLVDLLENAKETDTVLIYLTGPGGNVDAVMPFIQAMKMTEAFTQVYVEASIGSAATFIPMVADAVAINPWASVMIHSASYGYYGFAGNVASAATHLTKAMDKIAEEIYEGFLTPQEIELVKHGQEIWFSPEEAMQRFQAKGEAQKAAVEAQAAILEAAKTAPKKPRAPRKKKEPLPQAEVTEE